MMSDWALQNIAMFTLLLYRMVWRLYSVCTKWGIPKRSLILKVRDIRHPGCDVGRAVGTRNFMVVQQLQKALALELGPQARHHHLIWRLYARRHCKAYKTASKTSSKGHS